MGENGFDIDRLLGIFDFNYQSVIIALDVEDRAFTYQVGGGEVTLCLRQVSPSSSSAYAIPNPQRGLGVGVLFPKFS